jgi:DNA transformation protein
VSASPELIEHYAELLAPIGAVESKRMFSGAGFSQGGFTFAMLIQEELYMRVDDETRPRFEAAGCEPFSYTAKDRTVVVKRYYTLPDDAVDNAERLVELGEEALAAARRDDIRKNKSV